MIRLSELQDIPEVVKTDLANEHVKVLEVIKIVAHSLKEKVREQLRVLETPHEFEKDVKNAATIGDPNLIPSLLEQYNTVVRALDFGTR